MPASPLPLLLTPGGSAGSLGRAPLDTDFSAIPPDGYQFEDLATGLIYTRVRGAWVATGGNGNVPGTFITDAKWANV